MLNLCLLICIFLVLNGLHSLSDISASMDEIIQRSLKVEWCLIWVTSINRLIWRAHFCHVSPCIAPSHSVSVLFSKRHMCSSKHSCFLSFTEEFHPEGSGTDDEETIEKDEEGIDEVFFIFYITARQIFVFNSSNSQDSDTFCTYGHYLPFPHLVDLKVSWVFYVYLCVRLVKVELFLLAIPKVWLLLPIDCWISNTDLTVYASGPVHCQVTGLWG